MGSKNLFVGELRFVRENEINSELGRDGAGGRRPGLHEGERCLWKINIRGHLAPRLTERRVLGRHRWNIGRKGGGAPSESPSGRGGAAQDALHFFRLERNGQRRDEMRFGAAREERPSDQSRCVPKYLQIFSRVFGLYPKLFYICTCYPTVHDFPFTVSVAREQFGSHAHRTQTEFNGFCNRPIRYKFCAFGSNNRAQGS